MSRRQDVVVTSLPAFCSLSLVVMMSRHRFSCRDITGGLCRLYCCRDIKFLAWEPSIEFLLLSQPQHQISASFNMLSLMSRHQSSCRDITLCCCRLYWVVYDVATPDFLSRHHFFNFCSFPSCLRCGPCRDLLHLFLQFL